MPVYESRIGLAGWNRDGYADVICFNVIQVDQWKKYSSFAHRLFHNISFTDLKTMSYIKKNRAKIYTGYWFSDKVKKRLGDFSLNSFADLVIVEAILNISPDDIAENLLSDIIKRQKKGYKPLFDGSDEILGETYGKILFQEQFIHIVQLITGWDFAKADMLRRNMAEHEYDEIKKAEIEFMECAVGRGFSVDSAKELFMTLYDSSKTIINTS